VNVIVFEGNMVKDPELKTKGDDVKYCQFTLADTYKRSGETGEGNTVFLPCVVFGDLAANLVASASKGARIEVTGRISQSSWTVKNEDGTTVKNDDGSDRTASRLECVANSVSVSLRWATASVAKVRRSDSAPPEEASIEAAGVGY
jgi:single-strand DNA-binding protein